MLQAFADLVIQARLDCGLQQVEAIRKGLNTVVCDERSVYVLWSNVACM